jgi:hypothetical protein
MEERDSPFLRATLPPLLEDKFVTLNRAKTAWGPKVGSWSNAVKTSPCETTLQTVVADLNQKLDGDVNYSPSDLKCLQIRQAMGPILKKNWNSYVRPEPSVLATGSLGLIQEHIRSRPRGDVFPIERYAFCAILKHHGEALCEMLNMETAEQCTPDDPWALCLVRAKPYCGYVV